MSRRLIAPALAAAALAVPAVAPAAKPAPKPQNGGTLTATANRTVVLFGRQPVITGKLSGVRTVSGQAVTLQQQPYPFTGKFTNVATAVTGADGSYTFSPKPLAATHYRVVYGNAKSAELAIQVRLAVSRAVSDRTPKAGTRVRFYGRVNPKHVGRQVAIQRKTSAGTWKTVAKTVERDVVGKSYATYSVRVLVRSDGRYRVRAASGDADHLTGASSTVFLDSHR